MDQGRDHPPPRGSPRSSRFIIIVMIRGYPHTVGRSWQYGGVKPAFRWPLGKGPMQLRLSLSRLEKKPNAFVAISHSTGPRVGGSPIIWDQWPQLICLARIVVNSKDAPASPAAAKLAHCPTPLLTGFAWDLDRRAWYCCEGGGAGQGPDQPPPPHQPPLAMMYSKNAPPRAPGGGTDTRQPRMGRPAAGGPLASGGRHGPSPGARFSMRKFLHVEKNPMLHGKKCQTGLFFSSWVSCELWPLYAWCNPSK